MLKCSSRWFAFEIPVEWWVAAGMLAFTSDRPHYRAGPPDNPDHATIILPIDTIDVRPRGARVPLFAKDRMIRAPKVIRLAHAMEPIHVFDEARAEGRPHVPNHDYHRRGAASA